MRELNLRKKLAELEERMEFLKYSLNESVRKEEWHWVKTRAEELEEVESEISDISSDLSAEAYDAQRIWPPADNE